MAKEHTMEIPFQIKDETIYLIADYNSYSLAFAKHRNRNGVDSIELEPFKWFASISQALNRLIDMKVRASDAKNLLELRQIITSARDEVNEVWRTSAEGGKMIISS